LASTTSAKKMNWCFLENVNGKVTVKSGRDHPENGRGVVFLSMLAMSPALAFFFILNTFSERAQTFYEKFSVGNNCGATGFFGVLSELNIELYVDLMTWGEGVGVPSGAASETSPQP
jgi:hypothetical protein